MIKYAEYQTIPKKLSPYEVHILMKSLEQKGSPMTEYYINDKLWSDRLEDRKKRREKSKEADLIKKSEWTSSVQGLLFLNTLLRNK